MSNFTTYFNNMILSASGWRCIFASSQNEEDSCTTVLDEHKALATLAAMSFAEYMKEKCSKTPYIIVGMDSRPTGPDIADVMIKALLAQKSYVEFVGIVAAPEIMAYAKKADGFVYISASHNPVGHNGIKFGFSDGGVMPAVEAKKLISIFKDYCSEPNAEHHAKSIIDSCSKEEIHTIYNSVVLSKHSSYTSYLDFSKSVISGETNTTKQNLLFSTIRESQKDNPLLIVCDMNGSARCLTIDKELIESLSMQYESFNDKVGTITHAIIPEGKNLEFCANRIEALQADGIDNALLGYLPDCDGDRGNIVFWNKKTQKAEILQAQEVFALSVLSEFAYNIYKGIDGSKLGVAVNCSTSMRIEEIAKAFDASVFRAEVGEANVVNCAREQRENGYIIPILGEGSNGGNITHPAAVRDPINTLFALIKLLVIKSTADKKGLFELWCEKSGQTDLFKEDFSLIDIIETLPKYTTTGVSEERALLKINTQDHAVLKRNFQKVFTASWEEKKEELKNNYGFTSWQAVATNSTKEIKSIDDFGLSDKGGLKIAFQNDKNETIAFMWMRGSGTEPVFRVMVDFKGDNIEAEKELIAWESELLANADKM